MRVFFLLALILQFSLLASSQPLIIAHRGSSFIAPENTLSAAKLAWEQDADAVECDIYLSNLFCLGRLMTPLKPNGWFNGVFWPIQPTGPI